MLTVKFVLWFAVLITVVSADIHCQISDVCGENIMSDGMVHKWARAFKYDGHNVHDEESSGQLSVITEDLVQKVAQK